MGGEQAEGSSNRGGPAIRLSGRFKGASKKDRGVRKR